jgi:Opioid growth factor receptor (OGFr) conserved region
MPRGSRLRAFLNGTGSDSRGRTLSYVLALDDTEIEATHDFIQWLFPLPVASAAQPNSPILSAQELSGIAGDDVAVANLKLARARMELFYTRSDHWLRWQDHNHLRITRILTSLRLIVGLYEARQFHAVISSRLKAAPGAINPRSLRFWAQALSGDANERIR